MALTDEIANMRNQGMNEQQIVQNLRERGVPPKDINNALSQSQIKQAVYSEEMMGMQPSVMSNQQAYQDIPELPENPQYEEFSAPPPGQNRYADQNYSPQDGQYENYQDYGQGGYAATDTDTIIEISDQVFNEKIKKTQKQLDELREFKTITETKLENALERLRKLESTIDRLQAAIIEKVGAYGNTLQVIRKEMSMVEDSFGKVMSGQSATTRKPKKTTKLSKKKNKGK